MAVKSSYASYDAIPEGDRQHYKQQGAVWVLDVTDLENLEDRVAPGLKATRDSLRTEKERLTVEVSQRDQEITRLKGQVPGHGQIVISKADAERLDKFKAFGEPKDLETKLAAVAKLEPLGGIEKVEQSLQEAAQTKQQLAQAQRTELLRKAAGVAGYSEAALVDLATNHAKFNGLNFEVRKQTVVTDGKSEERDAVFVKYKDGETEKEAVFSEYVKAQGEQYVGLLTAGQQQPAPAGTPWVAQTPAGNPPSNNPFQKIRETVKKQQEATPGQAELNKRFNRV
jgi:hypothetical protein